MNTFKIFPGGAVVICLKTCGVKHEVWSTFASVDDLARIPREAVVFHRSKDGSLIRRLRETR